MDHTLHSCRQCQDLCLKGYAHVLREDYSNALQMVLLDAATACAVAADFVARESPLHGRMCAACNYVCQVCANICEEQYPADELILQVAHAANACAAACREVSGSY